MSSQIKSRLTWPPEAKEDQIQELRRQQFPPTSRHHRVEALVARTSTERRQSNTQSLELEERDGFRVLIDLTKQDKSEAIEALEEVLSQLKN